MIIGFQLLCGRFLAAGEEVVEGEARYLAPEFMDIPCKKVLDLGKTDLFALGIIIYEAICGNFPFFYVISFIFYKFKGK